MDDFTRLTWVFLMKHKSDIVQVFSDFYAYINTHFNTSIMNLRSDNALEICEGPLKRFLAEHGIFHQTMQVVLTPLSKMGWLRESIATFLKLQGPYIFSLWFQQNIGGNAFSLQLTLLTECLCKAYSFSAHLRSYLVLNLMSLLSGSLDAFVSLLH